MSRLALVLSAGGARGAYEAGVLYYLRTGLPKSVAHRNFEIMTGTSVGAMTTAGLGSTAHMPEIQGKMLKDIWFSITQEQIYRRDISATTHFLGSTLGGIMRNFLTFNPFHLANLGGPHFNSFLDTTPLRKFLEKQISWKQLNKNILEGPIEAVAINVTNLSTGHNELFLQKKPKVPYEGHYVCREGSLKAEHALASSAIPMVFPPVEIGNTFYADGGLRLFTPMSPAIQLGAEKLIVIGLRKRFAPGEVPPQVKRNSKKSPTIAEQMGRILNGFFLDRIQFDIEQLERINTMIDICEKIYGKNFLTKINEQMKIEGYTTDIAKRGLRKIACIEILPSEYISKLFMNWFERSEKGNFKFSTLEKMMVRILDIDPSTGSDLLSYLTFAPDYLRDLFELGYQDAKKQRNGLIEILTD